jgi:hypothetical protein
VLFAWVYNNTGGSLFLAVLFHAAFDLVGFTVLAPTTTWVFPVLYVVLLWAVVAVVVVVTGGRLSRTRSPSASP